MKKTQLAAAQAISPLTPPGKGARTRIAIKSAVKKLLRRKSYAHLTLADVFAATGMTVGGFYFHFRSLEELVDEIVAEFTTDLVRRLRAAIAGPADAVLRQACVSATELYADQPGVARAFLQLTRVETSHAVRWASLYGALCLELADKLREGRRKTKDDGWEFMSHALIVAILSELTRMFVFRDRQTELASPDRAAATVEAFCVRLLAAGAPLSVRKSPNFGPLPAPAAAMAPQPEGRGARTRARIMAAFVELLEQRRYGEIGIVDICERAGVTVGGFYFHFKKKEDLVREAVVAYVDRFWGAMHTALDLDEPFQIFYAASSVCAVNYASSRGLVRCINELAWSDRAYGAHWTGHALQWSARISEKVCAETGGASSDISFSVLSFMDAFVSKLFVELDPRLIRCAGEMETATSLLAQLWSRALNGRAGEGSARR